MGKPTIRIWGSENIRKVLKNEETLVTMSWPTSVGELMGKGGLITATRKLHSSRRSAIMKAFTNSAINGEIQAVAVLICDVVRKKFKKFIVSLETRKRKKLKPH